jgi:hypothetical protein
MSRSFRRTVLLAGAMALLAGVVWSPVPTVAAEGTPITVTARVVDAICMLGMGQKGETHRECAIACDKAGVRMYLLDEKANMMYAAMADAPVKDPNTLLREHVERVVTVKGSLFEGPGGLKVIQVKEVQAAQ